MKEEKYKCPLCHISHSYKSNEINNVSVAKEKNILCSSCLNNILREENNLIFPKDLIFHQINEQEEENEFENNINNTENNEIRHELSKSIIDEIRRDSKNKTLIQKMKHQTNNKYLLSNLKAEQLPSNYSYNNQNKLNLSSNSKSNKNINSISSYYKKKAVKVNIIPKEKEFMENINTLNSLYNIIERNENLYKNFNQKFFGLIENINDIFIQLEKQVTEIKNEIINKINNHITGILDFINLRRKEIFDKFQYCNYDISDLINSSLTWMRLVKEEKPKINILNLIKAGKELNNKYNFVQEINNIFNMLEKYKDNGMSLIKNEFNEMPIIIQENEEIIKSLNFTSYKDVSKVFNKNQNYEKGDINKEKKIYCKKIIDDKLRHNNTVSDFYQNKNKRKFKSINQDTTNITGNLSLNMNRISVSRVKRDINKETESNELSFPFLYSSGNKTETNNPNKNDIKYKDISEDKRKHESIQVNNDSDNNININFNGHIFNYNSDSNISIIIPEKKNINTKSNKIDVNKNMNKKKVGNNNNMKNKRRTPQKLGIKKKSEKYNLKRSFSFNDKMNSGTKYIKINKKLSLPYTPYDLNIPTNTYSKNLKFNNTEKKNNNHNNYEKTFMNLRKSKYNNKYKSNYKTLNNKELEKYVNYQLQKIKPNFNRINLNDYGIKLICSFFNQNKNKIYKEIKLQGCLLGDINLELLIKSLMDNNILIPIINISENELTDSSIESIIKLLIDNEVTTNLNITNNSFSRKGKDKLKKFVKKRKEELFDINIKF